MKNVSRIFGLAFLVAQALLPLAFSGFLVSCGRNVLAHKAPANPEEQAQLDMEAGRYQAAQVKLEALLQSEPINYKATSLLAASIAAQGGVTMFALLQKAASTASTSTSGSSSNGSSDTISKMIALLPDIQDTTLEKMEIACATMAGIPAQLRTAEMVLQTSVFYSTLAFLKIKQLKENPDLLAALTPEQAASILSNFTSAIPASISPSDPISKGSSSVQKSIASAAGANDVDKLKAVLGNPTSP